MTGEVRLADGVAQKTPDEVLKIDLDYNQKLATGELLTTVDSTLIDPQDDPTLVIDSTVVSSPFVQVTLSGGAVGGEQMYTVLVRVNTDGGQILDGAVRVCVDKAT